MFKILRVQQQDWDGALWVLKATAKEKEGRYGLSLVYSTGKHLIATDGHRLHAYRLLFAAIPRGAYSFFKDRTQIIFEEASDDMAKMDIKNLVDVFPRKLKTKIKTNIHKDVSATFTELVRNCDPTLSFNVKYIEDATPEDTIGGFFRIFDNGSPTWLKAYRRSALVMPVRM